MDTTSIFSPTGAPHSQPFSPAAGQFKTRFGDLTFLRGYPTDDTVQKVYDELDLQRATQLYLDMYPTLSMHGMLTGVVRDYGVATCSDICVTANRLDSKALFLTGNTESIYVFVVVDTLVDGPTVVEVPPGVMGPLDDHTFKFVFDIGPTGKDEGKGGKYLVLPPDYDGDVPDGYFVFRSPTYVNFSFMRANAAEVGFGDEAMSFVRENCKVYPLSTGPREGRFTNVSGVPSNTLVPEDGSAFEWMHQVISYEPADAFGRELLGRLASLGIERGKPFSPDARMRKIFDQAAVQGVAMSRVIAFSCRDDQAVVYPDRRWESPYVTNNSTFYQDDYINLEARTVFHFCADGITPAMAAQMPEGKGVRPLPDDLQGQGPGNFLDGNKTYKVNVPAKVPSCELLGGHRLRPVEPLRDPEPALPEHQQPAGPATGDQPGRLGRHLLRHRQASRRPGAERRQDAARSRLLRLLPLLRPTQRLQRPDVGAQRRGARRLR